MRRHYSVSLLLIIVVSLAALLVACGGGGAPNVDWSVEITGAVSNPLTVSYGDLSRRPQVALEDVVMRRSQGEDTTNSWEGPAVGALLNDAGASAVATAVICTAADGYAREIAIDDLHDAIIALKSDGAWLPQDDTSGPIRLVVPGRPANHWLSQLVSMEVVE